MPRDLPHPPPPSRTPSGPRTGCGPASPSGSPTRSPRPPPQWATSEAVDAVTLAAVAATAGRWLAGFLRVVGWPLPARLTLLGAPGPAAGPGPSWRPGKGSPITVACGADARIGRVTGAGCFGLV